MEVTIDLDEDIQADLLREAGWMKMTLKEYLQHALIYRMRPRPPRITGAELVAQWEADGVIGSRPDITDPYTYARELRAAAERRVHE